MGRQSTFTPELAKEICARLSAGESLRSICNAEHMPHESTVRLWVTENIEGFATQYARARETQADSLAEEILDIADNESLPADSRRIRVDVRKWFAGKVRPKKYGDSTQIKHSDADGGKLSLGQIFSSINGTTSDLPRDDEAPEQ